MPRKAKLTIALVAKLGLVEMVALSHKSDVSVIIHGNGNGNCELIGPNETSLLQICAQAHIRTLDARARFFDSRNCSIFTEGPLAEVLEHLSTTFELTVIEVRPYPLPETSAA